MRGTQSLQLPAGVSASVEASCERWFARTAAGPHQNLHLKEQQSPGNYHPPKPASERTAIWELSSETKRIIKAPGRSFSELMTVS